MSAAENLARLTVHLTKLLAQLSTLKASEKTLRASIEAQIKQVRLQIVEATKEAQAQAKRGMKKADPYVRAITAPARAVKYVENRGAAIDQAARRSKLKAQLQVRSLAKNTKKAAPVLQKATANATAAAAKVFSKLFGELGEEQYEYGGYYSGYAGMGADVSASAKEGGKSVAQDVTTALILRNPAIRNQVNALAAEAGEKATEKARAVIQKFYEENKVVILGGGALTLGVLATFAFALLRPRKIHITTGPKKEVIK